MDSHPEFPTTEVVAPAAKLGNGRPDDASHENPAWNAVDLIIGACAFLGALFVSTSLFVSVAAHTTGTPYTELVKNPGALIVVPAMILGYIALISTLYLRLKSAQSSGFWNVIGWHWPG